MRLCILENRTESLDTFKLHQLARTVKQRLGMLEEVSPHLHEQSPTARLSIFMKASMVEGSLEVKSPTYEKLQQVA